MNISIISFLVFSFFRARKYTAADITSGTPIFSTTMPGLLLVVSMIPNIRDKKTDIPDIVKNKDRKLLSGRSRDAYALNPIQHRHITTAEHNAPIEDISAPVIMVQKKHAIAVVRNGCADIISIISARVERILLFVILISPQSLDQSKTAYPDHDFVSWYSFSVLTFQISCLSVLPSLIASAALIAVSMEWSILL